MSEEKKPPIIECKECMYFYHCKRNNENVGTVCKDFTRPEPIHIFPEKRFKCGTCGKMCASYGSREYHRRRVHEK